MAVGEYSITSNHNFRPNEWLSVRALVGLLAGASVYFGGEIFFDREVGILTGITVAWIVAGLSAKVLFVAASVMVLGIMILSVGNADMQVGDEKVVDKLAIWTLYCTVLGAVKMTLDSVSSSKNRPRGNRSLVKILPTATRSKLDNTLMHLDVKPAPQSMQPTHVDSHSLRTRHSRPLQF